MKTKLLFTIALIFTASFSFSQNLVLSHDGETLEPDAEITVQGLATAEEIVVELAVTNTGSATIDVLCQRYEVDMVDGSVNTFCWGGLCYPPWTGLSAIHHTIGAGITIDDDFSGHYEPEGNAGISTIAYTFFDMNDPNDSVQVTILFDGMTVGVNEISKYNNIEVYPNPANQYVKVDLNVQQLDGEVNFQLIDITGSIIQEVKSNSTEVRINTSDVAKGLYMYRAIVNDKIVATDKLVIQH